MSSPTHMVRAEQSFPIAPIYDAIYSVSYRFRPFNKLEIQQNSEQCIDVNEEATTVYMKSGASLGELILSHLEK
jgi:hypothetical protein